ncbi:MAG TPA: cob(I)yrinic acid a,c-diamide adenosyltransferase [Saprospiraceae bacterium]|jgi:cob(I)alamin adenosyltransferase|nr:cob(I)yrinic acid a,c-diamide adenosyltransferase [Saprospiraceae bacterium]HOJ92018.1 cob(I)yrinic acid a,c-diamide adenosyltransferase [Saprospiraceae bacterium]HUN15835.1 cob(I)yrinic acid a,c-diamide adenosyltransferase [Saprospiraceae bacterium]
MKIYTKTGDKGQTSLFDGTRLSKDDIRIEAYGTVDELNSNLGLLISLLPNFSIEEVEFLIEIQRDLFVIGSYLATPFDKINLLKLKEIDVTLISKLEIAMDTMDSQLKELKSFILPGGSQSIAVCHICRTVCRRAERRVVTLASMDTINENLIIYLNRLSDYFFTMSRFIAFKSNIKETIW